MVFLGPVTAIFVKALINSNPDLKEIRTDTWEGGVKVSKEDKATLKMKGIEYHEEYAIPDSDIDSEEEGEVEDEENSDEDSDRSEDNSEDSDSSEEENSESSGEENSEDEIEGGIEENGADIRREERSLVWWIFVFFSFTLLFFLLSFLFLYYLGNLS